MWNRAGQPAYSSSGLDCTLREQFLGINSQRHIMCNSMGLTPSKVCIHFQPYLHSSGVKPRQMGHQSEKGSSQKRQCPQQYSFYHFTVLLFLVPWCHGINLWVSFTDILSSLPPRVHTQDFTVINKPMESHPYSILHAQTQLVVPWIHTIIVQGASSKITLQNRRGSQVF